MAEVLENSTGTEEKRKSKHWEGEREKKTKNTIARTCVRVWTMKSWFVLTVVTADAYNTLTPDTGLSVHGLRKRVSRALSRKQPINFVRWKL